MTTISQARAAPFPPARGCKVTPEFSNLQARLGVSFILPSPLAVLALLSCRPAHSSFHLQPPGVKYGFTGLKITVFFLFLFSPSKPPLAMYVRQAFLNGQTQRAASLGLGLHVKYAKSQGSGRGWAGLGPRPPRHRDNSALSSDVLGSRQSRGAQMHAHATHTGSPQAYRTCSLQPGTDRSGSQEGLRLEGQQVL